VTAQTELDLMRCHVSALFRHNDQGRLLRVNTPDGAEAPRFFLGRTPTGNVWRFRYDISPFVVEKLEALSCDEPTSENPAKEPRHHDRYLNILATESPLRRVSSGPAFLIPPRTSEPHSTAKCVLVNMENVNLLSGAFDEWIADVPFCQPFLAALKDGRAVSLCASVRITSNAHEAGVETLSEHRRKGYASEVVSEWAAAVRKLDRFPLYSTSWENDASLGVASRLGALQYGVDFQVT